VNSAMSNSKDAVFINVPFDNRYRRLFDALVFAVSDCGLTPRCALEGDDGSQVRLEKLLTIIEGCALGIHDLSRTTLDTVNRLPRFNMPLELGLFLGAKRFGNGSHKHKSALVLDREPYRYQKFCSDIAGQDVRAHSNRVDEALKLTRNWLRAERQATVVPTAAILFSRYLQFREDLPRMCKASGGTVKDLTFVDLRLMIRAWIEENPLTVG